MFDGVVLLGDIMWIHRVWPLYYPWNNRTGVGAYRIRPSWRGRCMFDGVVSFAVIVSYSLFSGRMRYAPTVVRWYSWVCWIVGWLRFRSFEGVCDTPLHMFDWFLGYVGLGVGSIFAHFRAYAIRPYTCSIINDNVMLGNIIPFSPTSGRMRFAPTHVRW